MYEPTYIVWSVVEAIKEELAGNKVLKPPTASIPFHFIVKRMRVPMRN